ncbi:hypothetical protein M3P19_04715 [Muricauda sp. 2012CJ35-5]|uniref:Uncharacterized protein n=1 Tax=Flagellimonas spongiicola TaxID=2942208 RepID=A0ABT0PS65_9FLAO|nr:hypothetical protein [Allomuricauda spongiicola]MCL6273298.1 hypothetical protein [Allomuricauda spongiicola]
MRNENGQRCPQCNAVLPATGAPNVPPIPQLTPAQIQLLDFVNALDAPDMVRALKLIHDLALYHSDGPLDDPEKVALYWMKGLWECLEQMNPSDVNDKNQDG